MRRDQRGVALVELLVGLVVFAILFLVIDAVFISAHRGARKAEVGADVNQNARVAVERLVAEIRESSVGDLDQDGIPDIQVEPGGTAVIFRSARPSDGSNSFCLNWNSSSEPLAIANQGCTNPPPPLDPPGTYAPVWQRWIGYYFEAGELKRVASDSELAFPLSGACTPAAPCQVIATSVESFTITPPSGDPATLTITLKGKGQEVVQGSGVPPQEILLTSTVVIRN